MCDGGKFLEWDLQKEIRNDRLGLEEAMFVVLGKKMVYTKKYKYKCILKECVLMFDKLRHPIWNSVLKLFWKNKKSINIEYYPNKDIIKSKLFKKIYTLVKRDLNKYGEVSKETIERVEDIFKHNPNLIIHKFRRDYWGRSIYARRIRSKFIKQHISIEEAALEVLNKNKEDRLEDGLKLANFIKGYETAKREQKKGEELFIPKTGERIPFPKYPIKDKKKYNLFKKIYKMTKKDLDKTGKISDKTLEEVRKIIRGYYEITD